MVELGDSLGFDVEAFEDAVVVLLGKDFPADHLDGDFPVQVVPGLKDNGHAAGADLPDDQIFIDALPCQVFHAYYFT